VVVLDLSTAHADLYRQVAAAAAPAPVVCVVAGDAEAPGEHKVARPFGPRVLIAAVAAALRTREDGDPQAGVLRSGALTLDTGGRTVVAGDREPALTATEFDLLAFLLCNPGRVFTREQLLAAVWGSTGSAGTRTVDVHIAQLRAKLRDVSPIRTVRGVGYAAGE
jgi:DNA-binding response OmpR family regulator